VIFGLYAQDSGKVSKRLAVNLGVRWDPFFGHTDPYGHTSRFSQAAFDAGVRSSIYKNAPVGLLFPGDPGGPEGSSSGAKFTNNRMAQFSPRIGIAWDPWGDGKTSIRAGYGLFYNFPSMSFDQFGFTTPFGGTVTVNNPASAINPWASLPGGVSPFPGLFGTTASLFPTNGNVQSYPTDTKPPTVQQFNFSLQRQFGMNWLVSASYLGNTSTHLWLDHQLNPAQYIPGSTATGNCSVGQYGLTTPGPCSTPGNTLFRRRLSLLNPTPTPASNFPFNAAPYYQSISFVDPSGTGSYNGLVLTLTHRFARNFSSTTNYTWSHCFRIYTRQQLVSARSPAPILITCEPIAETATSRTRAMHSTSRWW